MILKCYPIVLWAERIFRCTVQGKWISQDPVKSLESSLRCHWKTPPRGVGNGLG